mmetsp:Transcript_39961/g.100031  ORF Transcript_39961/g.100031 Transcript_39961/m.100031 type:complete len:230 (-) Transcript_39961:20-709(-)
MRRMAASEPRAPRPPHNAIIPTSSFPLRATSTTSSMPRPKTLLAKDVEKSLSNCCRLTRSSRLNLLKAPALTPSAKSDGVASRPPKGPMVKFAVACVAWERELDASCETPALHRIRSFTKWPSRFALSMMRRVCTQSWRACQNKRDTPHSALQYARHCTRSCSVSSSSPSRAVFTPSTEVSKSRSVTSSDQSLSPRRHSCGEGSCEAMTAIAMAGLGSATISLCSLSVV